LVYVVQNVELFRAVELTFSGVITLHGWAQKRLNEHWTKGRKQMTNLPSKIPQIIDAIDVIDTENDTLQSEIERYRAGAGTSSWGANNVQRSGTPDHIEDLQQAIDANLGARQLLVSYLSSLQGL